MTISDAVAEARYIVDAAGNRVEVILPVTTWERLLRTWERLADLIEDQEDQTILQAWLTKQTTTTTENISLDELERELVRDGLLPS